MTKPATPRRRNRTMGVIAINALVVVALFLAAEGLAKAWLQQATGTSHAYLFHRSAPREGALRDSPSIPTTYLDPHLGYAHDHDRAAERSGLYIPGFQVYGDPNDIEAVRIVTLGGSTMDPFFDDDASWPELLHTVLTERGDKVCVFNGGVAGYSSNQELLKFLRDGVALGPDIAIAFNGVNDMGYVHSKAEHPLVHRFQDRLFQDVAASRPPTLFPNLITAVRSRISNDASQPSDSITGVNYGLPNPISPAENWRRNQAAFERVAAAHGIQYLNVLQPIGGFGRYTMSGRETKDLEARGGTYFRELAAFYTEAQGYAKTLPFCADLTDVFADEREIYTGDMRHQTLRGREVLARAIAAELVQRKMLARVEETRASRMEESRRLRSTLLTPREPAVPNLIENASFEFWNNDAPSGWQIVQGPAAASQEAVDGLLALQLGPPETQDSPSRVQQMLRHPAIKPGVPLRIMVDASAAAPNRFGVGIYARVGDEQEVITADAEGRLGWSNHPGGGSWRTIEARAIVPDDAEADSLRLVLMRRPGGTEPVLVDNVTVYLDDADE
jgi:hypothetical protein